MRLGLIHERSNNAYYRAIFPMRALERRGHTVLWPQRIDDDLPLQALASCDLVHCYRRLDRVSDLQELARRGVAISVDNDDNFAAADLLRDEPTLAARRRNAANFRRLIGVARMADLVTTPSPVLADLYRESGIEDVRIIGNHLEREMFGFGSSVRHDAVVIGWVAGREHAADLPRIPIVETLKGLLTAHRQVRVLTVGVKLPLDSERYEHIPEIALPRLLTVTGRMDIGIAPLAKTAFNESRSDVKLKEYGAGGAAWVASPVGPYATLGTGQGGVLAEEGEWLTVLDDLIRSPRKRKKLARRALKWVKRDTIDHHVNMWEEAFATAVERAGARIPAPGRASRGQKD
jgi:hypothetical protein